MMFVCPISGLKLRKARAKGGHFWHSPHSGGRLLTLTMAKKFLGEDGAREIWVRSQGSAKNMSCLCPSCRKPTYLVKEPSWMGSHEVDVCRRCHLIWLDPGEHVAEVPDANDFIWQEGDSTVAAEVGQGLAAVAMEKEKRRFDRESWVGKGPDSLRGQMATFLGLPAEMDGRRLGFHHTATIGFLAVIFILQWAITSALPGLIPDLGFYPAEPFKNGGANIFLGPLFHGGWLHLLGNAYFFAVFANDVEEEMGFWRFVMFYLETCFLVAVASIFLSGAPELPHVGLSGFVMALMAYYALRNPRHRLAYVFPYLSVQSEAGGTGHKRGWTWLRVPAWLVLVGYFLWNFLLFNISERQGVGHVSYSSHLAGIAAGVLTWALSGDQRNSRALTIQGSTES